MYLSPPTSYNHELAYRSHQENAFMISRPTHLVNSKPNVFKNVCPLDCPDTCSMRVTVQDGVAIDLKGDAEHVFTRGFLCQKMARYLDRV